MWLHKKALRSSWKSKIRTDDVLKKIIFKRILVNKKKMKQKTYIWDQKKRKTKNFSERGSKHKYEKKRRNNYSGTVNIERIIYTSEKYSFIPTQRK